MIKMLRNISWGGEFHADTFAEALIHIRSQYGCSNWNSFSYKLENETKGRIVIGVGTLQHLAPIYHRTGAPGVELFWALEAAGVLRLGNGRPVTTEALNLICQGKLDAMGNPIKANADKG